MPIEIKPAVTQFLKQPITAALATINPDGSPQVTYVWYEFDGQRLYISTSSGRRKDRNVQRDPRVSLSVLDPSNPYRYVTVAGRVTVTEEGANDLIHRLSLSYLGADRGEAFARTVQGPDRVTLIMEPLNVYEYGF